MPGASDGHDDREETGGRRYSKEDVLHHRQLLDELDAGTGDGDQHGEGGRHGPDAVDNFHSASLVAAPVATYLDIDLSSERA